jgi:spermidine synthase
MIPWTELGRATVPGHDKALVLARRDDEFVIRVGPTPLMSSRMHDSEDTLAAGACARLAPAARTRVLVGGLGMGFTLAAALRALPANAEVVVAELVPAIVAWNRGPLAALAGRPLEDARVRVHVGDVAELLRASDAAFDAVLLDVDNGPDGLTRDSNDRLYSHAGLRVAARALRPGGVLAVWSVAPDREFAQRLADTGFTVEQVPVRAHAGKGTRHVLWFARRPARG